MNKKILLFDIETSLIRYGGFSLYPKQISYKTILEDFKILCAAWKWFGEKEIYSTKCKLTKNNIIDKEAVIKLGKAIEEADMLVYHNGDKFDIKKYRTRVLKNNLPPFKRLITSHDTLKVARKIFGFTSNRLDYLGMFLELGNKTNHSPDHWLDIFKYQTDLAKANKALDEMDKYCKGDVALLEKLWLKLLPYVDIPLLVSHGEQCNNPLCNSFNVIKWGTRITAKGLRYQRYKCRDCGRILQNAFKQREDGDEKIRLQ